MRSSEGIQAGQGAYFMTAHDLVSDLGRACREGRLDRRLRVCLAPRVLIMPIYFSRFMGTLFCHFNASTLNGC
jgi:hypothetical protein